MKTNKKTINLQSDDSFTSKLSIYQKSDDIQINASDLKLEFIHFKKAVLNTFTLPILTAVVSVWITLFTADFKSLFGLGKETILGMYLFFSIFVTLLLLKPFLIEIVRIFSISNFIKNRIHPWLEENEVNPEIKVNMIQKKCQNSEKNK